MLRIIISPAKKMNIIDEFPCPVTEPCFLDRTRVIHSRLMDMDRTALKDLWKCSDKLTDENLLRLRTYNLDRNRTPALLAYEGIQYQHIAPTVFSDVQWDYVCEHLRILSGMYGILSPTDGVIPYRLEMQAKLSVDGAKDLYEYWGKSLCEKLIGDGTTLLVNLASAEYSKSVLPDLDGSVPHVTCIFGEEQGDGYKVKATQAKIARGEMVRWMAEQNIKKAEELTSFGELNYRFRPELSSADTYVFLSNFQSV